MLSGATGAFEVTHSTDASVFNYRKIIKIIAVVTLLRHKNQ